jgi:hypothetical protein
LETQNVASLAYFKRWLADEGATLTITSYKVWQPDSAMAVDGWLRVTHKYEGIPRKVAKLQTKSVALAATKDAPSSWLDLDPASYWTFGNGKATMKAPMVILEYELRKD